MRVCLLNDSFAPVIDGVVNVMLNYAKYMKQNYSSGIIVGTPAYPDADYSAFPYPVVSYPSLDTAAVTNGYRTGYPFSSKDVAELADFKPDIIHSHCPATATIIARLLREETGAPIIFTYHTKYDIDIRRYIKLRPLAEEVIRAMVRNIEACDDIWVVSRGAGESLKALGFQGDYRVMNNGVDFAKGRVGKETVDKVTAGYDLPEGVPVFLFVGRLITYKGLPLILDALKTLDEHGRDFRMVFVGKGPDKELLEKKAAELGLGSKCIFTGPIYERDALRAWNTRADLFLFPSTFDTNGLVVREAAACGLASVLIKDSCAAEGVTNGRNGFIIEESADAMAAFLEASMGDLAHLHDVGQHAMDEIYLSWEDCVAEAYRRYQVIQAQKKIGILPSHKKDASDFLVSATATGMQETEKLRRLGKRWVSEIRGYRAGMMENILEAEESMDRMISNISEGMQKGFDDLWKQ